MTIRRIAGLIEYSPPVIYEYFDSKDDLLLELVKTGYSRQLEAVEEARAACGVPEEALFAMSRAWCRFAFEATDLYGAMYGLGGISFPEAAGTERSTNDDRDKRGSGREDRNSDAA